MTPVEFLQGKWIGHPVHPALVHIPAGLLPIALLFDVLSRLGVEPSVTAWAAFSAILVGLLGAMVAIPPGLADFSEIKPDKPAHALGLWHIGLNTFATVLFAFNLGLRFESPGARVGNLPLTLSALGALLVLASGYLGSRMAFDKGTGIARFSKQKWRDLAAKANANLPPAS